MINNHTQTTIASHNHCQSLAVQTWNDYDYTAVKYIY
jgi:hypothetical protein